jgi:two-component system OmpR family sensor kinase
VNRRRSFRLRLALRIGGAVLAALLIAAALAYRSLDDLLYDQLDTTLLRLAAIEAAGASDTRDSEVHFHDEAFLASGPSGEASLDRFAEVWTLSGEPVLRTRNLGARDLPLDRAALDRLVRSDAPSLTTVQWRGSTYRSILYPLGLVGTQHRPHILQVIASAEPTESLLGGFLRRLATIVALGTAAAFVIGWWIAGGAISPITRIVEQAEQVQMTGGVHEIQARAETEEMERLIDVLNSMLARIDAAFESQRRFLADVGHEIRTPLTVLRGEIEVALMRPRTAKEYEQILRRSLEDLRVASTLAGDLLLLARGQNRGLEPLFETVDVGSILHGVAEARAGGSDLRIEVRVDSDTFVAADPTLLRRAIANLVDNAIRHGGERVELEGRRFDSMVEFRVIDHGPGIPPDERPHLFERFYRGRVGRQSGRGAGLGLAIIHAIVKSHAGSVAVEDTPGGGATFVVRLPAADSESF